MADPASTPTTSFWGLWKEFLPLSLSDVTMACGDPLVTTTLARLPDARQSIAALGIAKSLAVFFESPIIMVLHASNALAATKASRNALWRFVLLSCVFLTLVLAVLTIPVIFYAVATNIIGIDEQLAARARTILTLLMAWPAAIAWRRYFQGLLIYGNHAQLIGKASLARLGTLVGVLGVGLYLGASGELLAGVALISGILVETAWVTYAAYRSGVTEPPPKDSDNRKPSTLKGVWGFYWPLANSMVVVWGGRALLIAVIARSQDATIALAAWPAAWATVLVVANATRMIQQVIIRNKDTAPVSLLLQFACSVGLLFMLVLCAMAFTSGGYGLLQAFLGSDLQLVVAARPVVAYCAVVPLLIALQNAFQGLLISEGLTGRINTATWIGTAILLAVSIVAIRMQVPGAQAASLAMVIALSCETSWLALCALRSNALGKEVTVDLKIQQ